MRSDVPLFTHWGYALVTATLSQTHAGWTQQEAIDSLVRKAGYSGRLEELEILRPQIRTTRYQSTAWTLSYVAFHQSRVAAAGVDTATQRESDGVAGRRFEQL